MFINGRVAVTAHGVIDEKDITPHDDVIFIRTKMDYGTRQRVIGAMVKAERKSEKTVRGKKGKTAAVPEMGFDVAAYQIALLTHNILEWRGPSFAGVACSPANIERLDPDEPLVKAVLEEIGERNPPAESDEDEDGEDEGNDPNE